MPVHAAVYQVIKTNIDEGVLRPGMALGERNLADQFAVSRVPVSRALRELAAAGFLTRSAGRGFRVAGDSAVPPPEAPPLTIPATVRAVAAGQASWLRICRQVERDLVACMPFGRFKIIELTMAEHYRVSRTVTRDLLARLEERGLIERAGRSQCHLPALTQQLMRDLYEVRRLLEPAALIRAAPMADHARLAAMRDALAETERRYPDVTPQRLDDLETDLHVTLIDAAPNRRLIAALRASQLPLLATKHQVTRYLGVLRVEPFLAEHRLIVERLLAGGSRAAAAALENHLLSALDRNLDRIALVRTAHAPTIPPYLQAQRAP